MEHVKISLEDLSIIYPKSLKHFDDWFKQYKKNNFWDELFNETGEGDCGNGSCGWPELYAPKYHQLPVALQYGIFIEYTFKVSKEFKLNFVCYTGNDINEAMLNCVNEFFSQLEEKLN